MRVLRLLFSVLAAASLGPLALAHAVSVKDSPGYYATPDPESLSVRLGRRTNAPLVRMPFTGGARSLDELGRSVVWTLHHGNIDSLRSLCVSQDEFRAILWREFPQSRPATGLQWEDAWTFLYARQRAGTNHAMREYGGHPYQFVRFEPGESTGVYKNFKLHSGLVMVTKDDAGGLARWRWLRSVAERRGRFKIYSTED